MPGLRSKDLGLIHPNKRTKKSTSGVLTYPPGSKQFEPLSTMVLTHQPSTPPPPLYIVK
jgi:hypothetical protein